MVITAVFDRAEYEFLHTGSGHWEAKVSLRLYGDEASKLQTALMNRTDHHIQLVVPTHEPEEDKPTTTEKEHW